jgi:hypothetical protein
MLGFIKCVLREFSEPFSFKVIYDSLVTSNLEYAASVWLPHFITLWGWSKLSAVLLGFRYVVWAGPISPCHLTIPGVFWWFSSHLLTEVKWQVYFLYVRSAQAQEKRISIIDQSFKKFRYVYFNTYWGHRVICLLNLLGKHIQYWWTDQDGLREIILRNYVAALTVTLILIFNKPLVTCIYQTMWFVTLIIFKKPDCELSEHSNFVCNFWAFRVSVQYICDLTWLR